MIIRTRDLAVRMRGEDVAELHESLRILGHELPKSEIERGHFGAKTKRAVVSLQLQEQLDVTGVVDALTADAIASALARAAKAEASERRPLARLIDAESGLPLSGLHIRLHAGDNRGGNGDLPASELITGSDGTVVVPAEELGEVPGPVIDPIVARDLVLEVLDPSGEPLYEAELHIPAGHGEPAEVAVPALPRPERPLRDLAGQIGLEIPTRVLNRLRRAGIETLEDVRAAGGLSEIGRAPEDEPVVAALEAHAALSVLPADARASAVLVEAGYRDILDVSATPRDEFVAALADELSPEAAVALHDAASDQTRFIRNVATAFRTGETNGAVTSASHAIEAATGQGCTCPECSNALSPLAYLADLLDYSLGHLRKTRGLRARYFAQVNFTDMRVMRTDRRIDFDWGTDAPDASMPADNFVVRWTGQVEPRYSETYTLRALSDDGVRVWVGNQLLIDEWQQQPPTASTATIALTAGRRYDLRVEYVDATGGAVAQLGWSSPSQPFEVIPAERLWPDGGTLEVTLSLLSGTYHQPFGRLPAECRLVEQRVRQVRLCIEVLRGYLAANPAPAYAASLLVLKERDYGAATYFRLLEAIGTSYDELREARTAPQRERLELAERLGITLDPNRSPSNPDELDLLFFEGGDPLLMTEDVLEALFGLRDTRRDPLDETPVGAVLGWRLRKLYLDWEDEDWPAPPPAGARPLIDPDLVGPLDFRNPSPGDPAFALWQQRRHWVDLRYADKVDVYQQFGLETLFTGPPSPGLEIDNAQLGVNWLGVGFTELEDIRTRQRNGEDVSADLAALRLDERTFEPIARLIELVQSGAPYLEPERSDVFSILTNIEKEEMFPSWRQAERNAGLTLGPDSFRERPRGTTVPLNPWRAKRADRRRWERTLRSRLEREDALREAADQAASFAEEGPLGLAYLRDALVLAAAPQIGDMAARADWLTRRLHIDCAAGICQMTTRIAQAIETLQGLLFATRNGLLEDDFLSLVAPDFDEEWRWIGSYAAWRSAMLVFTYPHTTLRPTLRRRRTRPFDKLVNSLRAARPVTAAAAREEAAKYAEYFADVCSLTRIGYCLTAGPLGTQTVAAAASRSVLALARGGNTGRIYFSSYPRAPGWDVSGHPDQTLWEEIENLPPTSRVQSLLPYQPTRGKTAAALFARDERDDKLYFGSFDGSRLTELSEAPEIPALVRASEAGDRFVPVDPALAAAGLESLRPVGNETLAALDVDGDGRREVLLLAQPGSDGSRRIGVLRERGAGLVVCGGGSLPAGWQLPAGSPHVLRTYDTYGPLERLLAVNPGTGRLGLLGWNPQTRTMGIVFASGASIGGWTVNASASFIAADVDGDARTELVAFEHSGILEDLTAVTSATVLDVGPTGMTFLSTQALSTGTLHPRFATPIEDHWFPRASARNPSGALDVVVHSRHKHAYTNPGETSEWVGVLRFDQPTNRLTWAARYEGAQALSGFTWASDDVFLAFDADSDPGAQELFVFNPSRPPSSPSPDTALFVRTADGRSLATAWSGTGSIAPLDTSGGAAISFARAAGDSFVVADVDGDGRDEIVAIGQDPSGTVRLAVAKGKGSANDWRSGNGKFGTVWGVNGRLRPPGGKSGDGWRLAAGSRYVAGDIDADGCDEIVALGADGRIGVFHGLPQVRTMGLPERLGPIGVTALDVTEKESDDQITTRRAQIEEAYKANLAVPGAPETGWNLTYLDEAYYFVPMELGIRLYADADHAGSLRWLSSVLDYGRPPADRKIAYGLRLEEGFPFSFDRAANWLLDPLDPHLIAATRSGSYTRFTVLTIVQCLLAYADSEYTSATAESIPRARALYLAVLELLQTPELRLAENRCQTLIDGVQIEIGEGEWQEVWSQLREDLGRVRDFGMLTMAAARLAELAAADGELEERVLEARAVVDEALESAPETLDYETLLERERERERAVAAAVLADPAVAQAAERAGSRALLAFSGEGEGRLIAELRDATRNGRRALADVGGADDTKLGAFEKVHFRWSKPQYVPAPKYGFCVPPDPAVDAARRHALLCLDKMRQCRNIAGMFFQPEPYALPAATGAGADGMPQPGPELQPLPYRFATLVEHARHLVDLARQIESSMLAALEKRDEEAYRELKARQDLQLARAGVRLKDLQLAQAGDGVRLAELQRDRSQLQQEQYREALDAGLNGWEIAGIAALQTAAALEAAGLYSVETFLEWAGAAAPVASAQAEVFNTAAAYERRAQEWADQERLAGADVRVGEQQIQIARNQVSIASQDRTIAVLQVDHAETGVEFLSRKFTNSDMYEWMSAVLEEVYRFFLQQATAMAQVAQGQLGFERQELIPAFIQADYWEPPSLAAAGASGNTDDDRHGLTGSVRLLRDITELDEYAFRTDQRKLQLSKTVALSQLDPYAFQRFRETGVLTFTTPLELFDRDFPGHYLRLIKRVNTSVIALVPPVEGIKATLSTAGTSRAVIPGNGFRKVAIQRGPESVALTSPTRATGLFDLDAQPEMLVPFEGVGVETAWELRMPLAANRLDYRSLAEVLLTIEYTALDSPDYRVEVSSAMDRTFSGERAFSFRYALQDQWYDLHNPDQTTAPMEVEFRVTREDFPPNLDELEIRHVTLQYLPAADADPSTWGQSALDTTLTYVDDADQTATPSSGTARPVAGLATTRLASGSAWGVLIGKGTSGTWTLEIPDTAATRALFQNDEIEDMLFVITFAGVTPPWPMF